ncbi:MULTISPECIES: phytanoyl-CoA dioxygenase family protein [Burkholderia]|jgi:ectoine hydroxylase-related dioxygenase (phytanoyl-CoA dioxygenase family)|uniref:Phytanoyl-CoA dioxygenase family protein n=2 Tax=Burkholderia contaminans TaxID=488447 RepID=A0A1E3FJ68_9BURK|nr:MULTISPECIES: phytanoyl-CoA dioxygenase family protein [Burkholderia]UTP26789.1 phytanoyl-CoA dioxygenase family protein [Burkholderia sp. FXe9]KKL42551.1 phytanoyl-CoA dioxygenase [Burkholderia contaminans LMG 23361]MBA9832251.1 phytanoyl-CoA dioxygenase family protein [Burkholderia contaminans]MBA9841672.1 phytanoyl-CoA dioxygenase family protein [Burkholderia contaminans]MBA9866236.1 phytanoyl-CoA dioxygenase family protein [Burkholderia contaminans]
MSLQRLSSGSTPEDLANAVRQDGGAIVKNFLDADLLARIQRTLFDTLESAPNGVDDYFAGTQTRRVSRLFARTDWMAEVALHPLYLGAARSILQTPIKIWSGENQVDVAPDIQVGVTQAIQILPGQGLQPLHRDDSVWLWRHPNYGREARFQVMVAVSDFTAENGATLVIPGSHKWDDERMPKQEEAIPATMSAGDALFFIGSTYHGGGKNTSDAPRTGLTMSYDLAILRQEENQYLTLPIERVKRYPEELQRLLGWTYGTTFAGFVERNGQMSDPNDLLKMKDFLEVGHFD